MMKPLSAALLAILLSCVFPASGRQTGGRPCRGLSENEFVTISQLNERAPESGSFNTTGYVVKKYTCPPCPPGAQCKPCMRDNIVISEDSLRIDTYDISKTRLVVFTRNPDEFKLGRKYRFSLRIAGEKSTGLHINDIELTGCEPADAPVR